MAETLPPMTFAELMKDLENEFFRSYVYIGGVDDIGWKNARVAQKTLPALRVYCAIEGEVIAKIKSTFNVPNTHVGIVFGWGTDVKKTLAKSDAEDFLKLTLAITEG